MTDAGDVGSGWISVDNGLNVSHLVLVANWSWDIHYTLSIEIMNFLSSLAYKMTWLWTTPFVSPPNPDTLTFVSDVLEIV